MKSKYFFKILAFSLLVQCLGCSKFVDVDPPKTSLLTSEAFKTDESATAVVLGIYSGMKTNVGSMASYSATLYPGMSADELIKFTPTIDATQFSINQLIPANSITTGIWNSNYKMIGQANSAILGLSQSTTLTPALKSQLLGEAKISRAFLYFYLVNLYGDVPLVLTTDWTATQNIARTPSAQVYAQIVTDLKEAASETSAAYPTSGKVRPNKFAALALLARVYLYMKDYKNAEETASQVIESGVYNLLPSIDDVFLADNAEAIWQLSPTLTAGNVTEEASIFVPSRSTRPPVYYFTENLLNSFEPGDKRKDSWIGISVNSGKNYYYPYKYKTLSPVNGFNEFYTLLRLSETYLIRAEARVQNNDVPGAVADLNLIRSRARGKVTAAVSDPLPELSASLSKIDAMQAVEHERQTELFAELGHRWFDLKRTGRVDAVLAPQKTTWTSNAQLYPIPQSEILLDNKLIQNPGY